MKTQKTIAVTMILASSVLTALVSKDPAYPGILCMLGLLGLQRRFTWDIKPEKRIITSLLLLLLAIMFAVHYRYGNSTSRVVGEQAASLAWQTIARYFLASMILTLFLGSPGKLPFSLGLFHVAVTISAGQVLLLDDEYAAFRLSELFSVILVVLYIVSARESTGRPISRHVGRVSRRLAFGLIFLITANCGWMASSILYRHVEVLNYLPLWFWGGVSTMDNTTQGQSYVGFSGSGKLSSVLMIKGEQDTTPMLTIKSDRGPGYLRARAFEHYFRSEWLDRTNQEDVHPEANGPFGMYFVGRKNLFRLDKRNVSNSRKMSIRHESDLADAVFTHLGMVSLEAPLPMLMWGSDDIVYNRNIRAGATYEIEYLRSACRKRPTDVQRRQMLDVPNHFDPRVQELANRIFADAATTTDKIDAVIRHFNTNYTYFLGMDIPAGRDKLTHFLLAESTGYCEYFASGAAMLLRMADVPTRYVTGFLVTNRDVETGLWIARSMDAHAWAEAWDEEQRQWRIVEATPGEDLGIASADDELDRLLGGGGSVFAQLVQTLYEYGLFGVPSWLYDSYGLAGGLLPPAVLFGAALCVALLRRRNRDLHSRSQSYQAGNPGLANLHKMLARMDRSVRAAGLQR
ncbi:MAG: transglutaminase-like domain-containing protein, partial [Planctomycetota bacterium]